MPMTLLKYDVLEAQLIEAVPELKCVYDDIIRQFNEMQQYTFWSQLPRVLQTLQHIANEDKQRRPKAETILSGAFAFVNQCMASGDDEIDSLIILAFLEGIYDTGKEYVQLKSRLDETALHYLTIMEDDPTFPPIKHSSKIRNDSITARCLTTILSA